MTTRIEKKFSELKEKKRAGLVTFVMGGDPNLAVSANIIAALPSAGADIIEIGIPFSDPMADGATIQAAGLRALSEGTTVSKIIAMVREFRTKNNDTPVILMGYYNPVYRYGVENFCSDAAKAGIDGLIIVDLPPEEEEEIRPYIENNNLKLIRLVAPTSGDNRLPMLCNSASGFIYCISVAGITGSKTANSPALSERIGHVRSFTNLPIAVGFGIKTAEQVKEASQFADAVVVGSALVEVIASAKTSGDYVKAATNFVNSLKVCKS